MTAALLRRGMEIQGVRSWCGSICFSKYTSYARSKVFYHSGHLTTSVAGSWCITHVRKSMRSWTYVTSDILSHSRPGKGLRG